MMKKIFCNASQILTCGTNGTNFKTSSELSDVGLLTDHFILVENGVIRDILPNKNIGQFASLETVDLSNKVVLPGIVESHTHTVFSGSRANEFKMRISGKSYEEIAMSGGGIGSTVKSVRNTSLEELIRLTEPKIRDFIKQGVTTLEIKSGYGLDLENELKILHTIQVMKEIFPIDIVATFLGAHTIPAEYKNERNAYVKLITDEMLPHIAKNKLAEFCDGFCEKTAFSADEIKNIFIKAKELGLGLKLHTEQFNNIGGLDVAVELGAVSIDHLEVLSDNDIPKLSNTETVCVLLPGVSFFLDYQFAPARNLIQNNCIVALATDYNPGSSHISNIQLIMSLAALKMKMKIEEIINCYTINAAKALSKSSFVGSIEIGKKADFAVFDTDNYADIVYSVGRNLNVMTIKSGNIIYKSD